MYHLAKLFHRQTNHDQTHPLPPEKNWPPEWTTTFYKVYGKSKKISLPKPPGLLDADLAEVLRNRSSAQSFSSSANLLLEQLSMLLYHSCGLVGDSEQGLTGRRSYASAGARYPLEIYLATKRVTDLDSGVYHYHVPTHSLELIKDSGSVSVVDNSILQNQSWLREASLTLVVGVVFDRVLEKYGDRGYRYILEEVGSVTHNFYLVATALGLGVSAVGGFDDDAVNRALDLDGTDESVVAVVAVGGK